MTIERAKAFGWTVINGMGTLKKAALVEVLEALLNELEKKETIVTHTPARDAYDLAEMITAKVQAGAWTPQSVADAIERLYEAMEAAKALETRP